MSLLFVVTSCVKEPDEKKFAKATLNKNEMGVYNVKSNSNIIVYSAELHQTAISTSGLSSRIQTDDQWKYVSLKFATDPVIGENVETTLRVRGLEGIEYAEAAEMEVLQIKDGKIWLLYKNLGFVMPW